MDSMDSHELVFVLGDVFEILSDAVTMLYEVSGRAVELTSEELECIDDMTRKIKASLAGIEKELSEISEGIG